jgi:chromate transporter
MFLDQFLELTIIANAFRGIKIAVGLLIADAAITMISKMPKKPLPLSIMTASFLLMLMINIFAWNFSSISLMILAAAVSVTVFLTKGSVKHKEGGTGK